MVCLFFGGVFCCVLLVDCSFLVVWIDSCTGSTNKVDNQNTNKNQEFGFRDNWEGTNYKYFSTNSATEATVSS